MIFYAIALLNDLISSQRVTELKDFVFGALALPLALLTSLMFWSMSAIDRELVFPKALDEFFPRWLDIILHTNVSILILMEMILVNHQYPTRKSAIRGLALFMLGYLIWIYVIFINTGRWVYGVIGILSAPQRIIFFLICGLVTLTLYFIGELLNKFCSGTKNVKAKAK